MNPAGSKDSAVGDWRIWTILVLVLITSSIVSFRLTPLPISPARVIYSHFWILWLIFFTAIGFFVLTVWLTDIPWGMFLCCAVLLSLIPVVLSMAWNVPYGPHDSWRHLSTILRGSLAPASTVYPALHAGARALEKILGVSAKTIVENSVLVSVGIGVLLLSILSRLVVDVENGAKLATLVGIPALYLGFVPRPFVISFPFIILFIWHLVSSLQGRIRSVGRKLAFVLVFSLLVIYHPLTEFIILTISGASIMFGIILYRTRTISRRKYGLVRDNSGVNFLPFSVMGLFFTAYFLLLASKERLITSAILNLLVGSSAGGGSGGDVNVINLVLSNPDRFVEFILNISYAGLLGICAVIALIISIYRHKTLDIQLRLFVMGIVVGVAFLAVTLVTSRGVALNRILAFAPFLTFPAAAYFFQQSSITLRGSVVVILSLLIVFTGMLSAFPAPLTGQTVNSGNEQQISAANWLVEHPSEYAIPAYMTMAVIRGLHGGNVAGQFDQYDDEGMYFPSPNQTGEYAWTTSLSRKFSREHTIFVVDKTDRARARQEAVEGHRAPIECLQTFTDRQNRIFSNTDTDMYVISTPRSTTCVGV